MSLIEYAQKHGIVGEELTFLRRYGTTDFNRTWFFVSEEMVRDDLGQPDGIGMMRNFYTRHLTRPLREGEILQDFRRRSEISEYDDEQPSG